MDVNSESVSHVMQEAFFGELVSIGVKVGLTAVGMKHAAICWNDIGATIDGQRETGLVIGVRLSSPDLPDEVRAAIENLRSVLEKAGCDQRVRPH